MGYRSKKVEKTPEQESNTRNYLVPKDPQLHLTQNK